MRKAALIIGIILSAIATFCLFVLMSFTGNPVSLLLSKSTAKSIITEKYSDLDLSVGKPYYNFKMGDYGTYVYKEGSEDIHFYIHTNGVGKYLSDEYESMVLSGENTYLRINNDYRNYIDTAIANLSTDYEFGIAYGDITADKTGSRIELPYLEISELEIDGEYDIEKLGEQYGKLVIYVSSDEVTADNAKKILKDVADSLEKENIQYYSMDFTLQHYKNEDGTLSQESVNLLDITKEDILSSDYTIRFDEVASATENYYKEQDKQSD